MARRFSSGLYHTPQAVLYDTPVKKASKNDEVLLLIILFILLAASPSLGLESRYFFIIIMTVIGLGGVGKAFGLNGQG